MLGRVRALARAMVRLVPVDVEIPEQKRAGLPGAGCARAASDYPVLVLARELAGAGAGAQVRRTTGVARPIIRAWPAVIPKREALFRPP